MHAKTSSLQLPVIPRVPKTTGNFLFSPNDKFDAVFVNMLNRLIHCNV
jgi:hypothetical protein